ncbi:MAG: TGS domain-containing protein, partial [Minisyncoccia bacterium]
MGKLAGQLQDFAFPYAHPDEAQMVSDLLKKKQKTDEKYMEKVWRTLKTDIAEHKIKNVKIHSRVKGNYSLWGKLKRKNMDMEKIYDIVALRIIVPRVEDCYRVLGIIHSKWRPLPGRIKDYIALPKTNGYQSIHTTIFTGDGGITEIQIRTQDMHDYAEFGLAAHHLYKQRYNDQAAWIQDLKEVQSDVTNEKQFINNLTTDFFEDRIFVFTPLGDVIDLPRGASAIDLAYTIHSEIGNTAQAATINGKHSALKTILKNGDIVEITTNKNAKPSRKWLDFAKTTIARKHINTTTKDDGI